MKNIKSILLAVSVLVLSTSVNAAIISTTQYLYGDQSALYNPYTPPTGYGFGIGAGENGTDRAVMFANSFNSSLGELVAVSLSYNYTSGGYLFAGSFSNSRVTGYSASASHQGVLNYGFDSVFTSQLENTVTSNSGSWQNGIWNNGISIPWNTAQLWNGYYAYGNYSSYPVDNEHNVVEFDSSEFDKFINQTFELEILSTTFNSSITGCNYLSTCAISSYTQTYVTGAALTYTYDDGVSAVPVPAAVWLFGSGLLGLVGAARSKA